MTITRRNFFGITLMMAALMFLFLFTEVIKDNWNMYETNEYLSQDEGPGKSDQWQQPENRNDLLAEETCVVLIGDSEKEGIGSTVSQWCRFSKQPLLVYDSLSAYLADPPKSVEMLLLQAEYLSMEEDEEELWQLNQDGVPMIFCNLPEKVPESDLLRKLLGIKLCRTDAMELEGIHLFSGFLLGGEVIYKAEKEEEIELQDLELTVPWYMLRSGTKVYMSGMVDLENVKDEDMPPIIWRNHTGSGLVFVVNGNYLADTTGIGILSAMMYEMSSYEIYPVVNAQNLTVVNYPGFASENVAEMNEIYSRGQKEVMRDIIWPGLAMVSQKRGGKMTCLAMTQFDYEDGILPQTDNLVYYLKLFNEQGVEMGLSLQHREGISTEEKIKEDQTFWEEGATQYLLGSCYVPAEEIDQMSYMDEALLQSVRTVTTTASQGDPIFDYLSETVTVQYGTADGFRHTYSDNLRMRSIMTALGYSNLLVNLDQIFWPEEEQDEHWEVLSKRYASIATTYWRPFRGFENTVLLESDSRIRSFLALDYAHERTGNAIILQVENQSGEGWFVLRTHGEEVDLVQGGTFRKLEKNAYLIEARQEEVQILLKEEKIRVEP